MKTKCVDDYIDELAEFFPQISKEELRRMTKDMTKRLTIFMKKGAIGFTSTSTKTLLDDGRRYKFQVDRLYNHKNLINVRTSRRNLRVYQEQQRTKRLEDKDGN